MYAANRKIYEFDNFRLDVAERQLLKNRRPVTISPKAFDLLVALVENKGRLVERESLYARVWPDSIVEDANLTVHISAIRKALEAPSCITTVSGHGYRFNWPVKEVNGTNGRARLETNRIRPERFDSGANHFALPEASKDSRVHDSIPNTKLASNRNSLISGMIGVVLITAVGIGSYLYSTRGSSSQIESIAVMPFANETGDPNLEYLSDGMTVSVISSLSKLPGLSVKARTSVFRYKGTKTEISTIGRELGVRALLNGRLAQRGENITLFVELIEPVSERILWSNTYHRTRTTLVSLQEDIARDLSLNLNRTHSTAQQQGHSKSDTSVPEAYEFYLRGRYHWNRREPDDLRRSIDYFDQAVALDPNYARAYTGIADAYAVYYDSTGNYPAEKQAAAKEAVLKALSLDDLLAEAHASLGLILYNSYDFSGAERELSRAIELDPNYAAAHHWYGNLLGALGRFDEMLTEHRRAMELEPLSPLMTGVYGVGLAWARRYEESLVELNRSLELDPHRSGAYFALGFAYEGVGDHLKAVDHFARAEEMRGKGKAAAKMRTAFADNGWQGFQRALVDPQIMPWSYGRARRYAWLGEKDRAFELLNEALEKREPRLRNIKIDPYFDGLREDPRYIELMRRIGFPQ